MSKIQVKNVSRGPQRVKGAGVLAHGERGHADDTPHLRALIDAGHLLEIQPKPPAKPRPKTNETKE